MVFVFPNPILLIIVLFGGMETWRRWKQRKTRSLEQAAYYRVSPRNRLLVGAVYIGLIVALAFGMHETHILSSAGHSFRSISGLGPGGRRGALAPGFAHGPFHVALGLALAERLALVVEVLAARERDLDLRVGAGEVDARRHERQPALGARAAMRSSSRRCSSSLRGRSGSWFSREAGAYGGMWTECSHSSPSRIAA